MRRAHGRRGGLGTCRVPRGRATVSCDPARTSCVIGQAASARQERYRAGVGERAGDRADDLRDRFGTARLFVPQRGVACDRERRVCLEDGEPDRKLTRRYFGRGAARPLNDQDSHGGDDRKGKRKQG
jgi:hypothetical protein